LGILTLIVVGLVAGVLAKIAMPGPDPGGILLTIVVGIAGAFLGGFIFQVLGLGEPIFTELSLGSIVVATLGAILLLVIYRFFTRRAA
jgi:uncharacterized membrane protein YeaQ/YmgE (transglycosylase-associated protein family)